jgi:hypothetical protein
MLGKRAIGIISYIFAPAAAVATTPAPANQFDLVCHGEEQFQPDMRPHASTHRYRINLDDMRWCWERCERTFPIVSATVDRITFNQEPNDGYRAYVSRIDGSYVRYNPGRVGTWTNDRGTCEPAPFSGMPQQRF